MNDGSLLLLVFSLLLPDLLIETVFLQDELGLVDIVYYPTTIFNNYFLHIVHIDF